MIAWVERWLQSCRERDIQRHFENINPETVTDIDKYLRDNNLF